MGIVAMEAYQKRVVEEKEQLDKRIHALKAFFESGLWDKLDNEDEKDRLTRQYIAMSDYSSILAERIEHF